MREQHLLALPPLDRRALRQVDPSGATTEDLLHAALEALGWADPRRAVRLAEIARARDPEDELVRAVLAAAQVGRRAWWGRRPTTGRIAELSELAPRSAIALAVLVRALLWRKDVQAARRALDAAPADLRGTPSVEAAEACTLAGVSRSFTEGGTGPTLVRTSAGATTTTSAPTPEAPLAERTGTTLLLSLRDLHGDTIGTVAANQGTPTSRASYSPWGEATWSGTFPQTPVATSDLPWTIKVAFHPSISRGARERLLRVAARPLRGIPGLLRVDFGHRLVPPAFWSPPRCVPRVGFGSQEAPG